MLVSRLGWGLGRASGSREYIFLVSCSRRLADERRSLGLTEVRLILAKLHFKFDVEAVDKEMDWVAKTKYRLLWKKPELWMRLKERV